MLTFSYLLQKTSKPPLASVTPVARHGSKGGGKKSSKAMTLKWVEKKTKDYLEKRRLWWREERFGDWFLERELTLKERK